MLGPLDLITPGMKVTAGYNDLSIGLEITIEVSRGKFLATVLAGPIRALPKDDLAVGDKVLIDREYICWIHGE